MLVIMGACGHVGSEVIGALRAGGQELIAVTHDRSHLDHWKDAGITAVLADVERPDSLRQVFRRGRRAFLLNPPAPVDTDTDAGERHTAACILEALAGSGLEKVVLASTSGARPGQRLGDLNVLWELEQGLATTGIPCAINRGGYYMSNWDAQLASAGRTGRLVSFFPAELRLPMVAPRDVGQAAARRLLSGCDDTGIRHVEGPARYSAADVAAVLGKVVGREVAVDVVPRTQWASAFRELGFSEAAAVSYARMTEATVDSLDLPPDPVRGELSLDAYIRERLARR